MPDRTVVFETTWSNEELDALREHDFSIWFRTFVNEHGAKAVSYGQEHERAMVIAFLRERERECMRRFSAEEDVGVKYFFERRASETALIIEAIERGAHHEEV